MAKASADAADLNPIACAAYVRSVRKKHEIHKRKRKTLPIVKIGKKSLFTK